MHSPEEIFDAQRSRLFGIAYRMLGSRADAEDTLQDAYIRWHGVTVYGVRHNNNHYNLRRLWTAASRSSLHLIFRTSFNNVVVFLQVMTSAK